MIIRRLAEAMQNQNWFTVFIEFLILVIGIFVGLQVNNWNEDRLDRKREEANLQRLLGEAEDAVAYISKSVEWGASRIHYQRGMLEMVFSDDPLPADTADQEWGFENLVFYPTMTPPRTTYDELTASGGMQLIRSEVVRSRISEYYAGLDWYQGQLGFFRQSLSIPEANPMLLGREYFASVYDPENEVGRRFVVDWSAIRNDTSLTTLLVQLHRDQVVMNGNREDLLAAALEMCQAIAREVGTGCDPDYDEAQ